MSYSIVYSLLEILAKGEILAKKKSISAEFGHTQLRDPKGWEIRSSFDELYVIRAFKRHRCCRRGTTWDGCVTLANTGCRTYPDFDPPGVRSENANLQ